ncbi:hypothetical protein Y1Q_0005515 [Alligator mississippiensis]|uniref:Reverse transcriptase domain-containing protein n=1 Tax=Alligator mississippiensis TaxID=8496 RepID=A0A151MEW3_ALLMI|nr:hypothetical protein Y1Q_0005515 [Alligator mississippiensis]
MLEVKAQIGAWYWEEARKKIFEARMPWVVEGEEWSAYFSELKKSKEKPMMCLRDGAGAEHWSKEGMLEMVTAFYQGLYTARQEDPGAMQQCLQGLTHAFKVEQQQLEEEWTLEELEQTLWRFNNGSVIHEIHDSMVSGHQIHGALLQLKDMFQLEWDKMQKWAVLNLGLKRAYDRVSHWFLFKTLKRMGVPPTITDSQKRMLYMDVSSEMLVNGFLSTWTVIESGPARAAHSP